MGKKIVQMIGIVLLPVVMFTIFFFLAKGFGFHTLPIIVSQSMIPTTLGCAMACVMPSGLMDFSPGARMLFGAVVGGILAKSFGLPGFLIGCFLGAMAGGIIIATLYRYLRIPSMVVSLGMVLFLEAFTDRVANWGFGAAVVSVDAGIAAIGKYPKNVIICFIACVLLYYLLYKTKLGCLISAVGNDEAMLKNMGTDVDSVKFKAFTVSGVFIFLAAILQICFAGSVQAVVGMGTMTMVFKPMMGVLIAMQLIKIYNNMPLMIFIGELTIQTVFNGFIALGLTDNIQNIVLGIFLITVLGVSENRERMAEWDRKRRVRLAAGK